MRTFAVIFCLATCSPFLSSGQSPQKPIPDEVAGYFKFDSPSPFACLQTYFPPLLIQHALELKSFIRSDVYRKIRTLAGDRNAVDAIYVKAMTLTDNNAGISLLLSLLATMEHRYVAFSNPVFNLAFPLTNESTEEYAARVNALPVALYEDSPTDSAGDKDKLQHFFGSAFLSFVGESQSVGDRFGMFIEKGERAFIIGGLYDNRDLRADAQGAEYGTHLLDNNKLMPSGFLTTNFPMKTDTTGSFVRPPDSTAVPSIGSSAAPAVPSIQPSSNHFLTNCSGIR